MNDDAFNWDDAAAEVQRLEAAGAQAPAAEIPALVARAEHLVSRLRAAAEARGLAAPAPGLQLTAEWLDERLRVGEIAVPAGAPEALRALVAAHRHRRITPGLIDTFAAELKALTAAARDAGTNLERVERDLKAAEAHRDLLARYEAALNALTGRG